jgi:nucleotide-binding universal stress UspA family protein
MSELRTILAATDFSSGATAAVRQACRLASASGAALHIIHAPSMKGVDDLRAFFPDTAEFGEKEAIEALTERVAERLANSQAPKDTQIHVRPGNPYKSILAAIDEFNPDLLIMGSTGESDKRLGTVGGRCVRKAPCDVMLVPAGSEGAFAHITACVDFSDLSPAVLEAASSIAKLDKGSITALYAHEKVDESIFVKGPSQDLVDKLPAVLEDRFDGQLRKHAGDTDVSFTMVTCQSYSSGIVSHATESQTNLVVTGTTNRSGIAYMLLGTTAEKVIREVGCAVLAVKPKAQ